MILTIKIGTLPLRLPRPYGICYTYCTRNKVRSCQCDKRGRPDG
jgi:hypothetical protein